MRRLFLSLCLTAAALPQTAKQAPPPPGPVRPFAFPKYETRKLANGLTVFAIEDHRQPLVSFRLEIATAGGSSNEAKKAGLASTTAQLLRQGTKKRSAQEIARTIDMAGGELGTGANEDTASVTCNVMKSSADLCLDLVADVVLNPAFPREEIDRLVRQSLSGLQVEYSDPQSLARLIGRRSVYGEHPYALPVEGTPDTLRALKREDIVGFHQTNYAPATSYFAISGDITPAEAFRQAEKYLASWKTPAPSWTPAKAKSAAARKIIIVDMPDAVQTQFSIGQVGVPRNDPDYIPLQIANQIFGGSFNSRLNMKLRANEGLTYGAHSSLMALRQTGAFSSSSFSRTEKTATAIHMMSDLLTEFREKPVTEAELKDAKAYLIGSFSLGVETPEQVAQHVLTVALNGLPSNYWDTYRDAVQAVTMEQVDAAVKHLLAPDRMSIVAVGNAKQFSKDLAALGAVQIIPLADIDITAPGLIRAKEAAPAATAETKARGMQLIQAAAEAVGGRAALDAVKDMDSKGPVTLSIQGNALKAESEELVLYPDKYKMVLNTPMGQIVQAHDGRIAWMQQGPNTRDVPPAMAAEMAKSVIGTANIGLLRAALEGKAEVSALDPVEQDGKKMNAALWKQGDFSVKILFDPETKRIAKVSYRSIGMQGTPADFEMLVGDYRESGGVQLPFQQTVYQNGEKFADISYTERKVNTGIKPEIFAKPAS